jgi:hypothetical protein
MKKFVKINRLFFLAHVPILVLVILFFNSCEKKVETYYLNDEETELTLLYQSGDTIKLKNKNKEIFSYYVYNVDSGIAESDFLGVSYSKTEWMNIRYKYVKNEHLVGEINSDKADNVFDYRIKIEFSENTIVINYLDNNQNNYKLQKKDQLKVDGTTYNDVYIFNNATSETAEPTQKIYLNTEYGFLKLEDLEKDVVYTIVRE